jgi:flagellar assembly protein FliH
MPLVKSEILQEKNLSVGFYSLADIEALASKLIHEAQVEQQQIIADAKKQARAILESAAKAGKQQGFVIGIEQGRKQGVVEGRTAAIRETQDKIRELSELLFLTTQQVEGYLQMLQAQAPRDVMKLSVEIARRVSRISGRHDPATLRANVEQAVRLLLSKSKARVLVNPVQHQLMTDIARELRTEVPQFENVQIVSDEQIAPGGCRIICGEGEIDADLDRQIDRIAAEVLPELAAMMSPADEESVQSSGDGLNDAGLNSEAA